MDSIVEQQLKSYSPVCASAFIRVPLNGCIVSQISSIVVVVLQLYREVKIMKMLNHPNIGMLCCYCIFLHFQIGISRLSVLFVFSWLLWVTMSCCIYYLTLFSNESLANCMNLVV